MARKIHIPLVSTPANAYVVAIDYAGQFWNVTLSAWEAYNASHWSDYAISISQAGSSIHFFGDFPTTAAALVMCELVAYARVTGTPLITDTLLGNWPSFNPITDSDSIAAAFWASMPSGIAQAGGASSITLAATASATNDFYTKMSAVIVAGTGVGQFPNRITSYNGTTKVATLTDPWATVPDTTSRYTLIGRIE